MGFVMLGISTLTSIGINAALFGMVAHGLITGMLFFLAGSVKERYHTLEIKRPGGMLLQMPEARLDPRVLRDGVARPARPRRVLGRVPGDPLGLQPAPGLREELYRTLMVIAAVGTVLAAAYLLWLFQRTAFGELNAEFDRRAARVAHAPGAAANVVRRRARPRPRRHPRRDDLEWIAWTPMLVASSSSASTRS